MEESLQFKQNNRQNQRGIQKPGQETTTKDSDVGKTLNTLNVKQRFGRSDGFNKSKEKNFQSESNGVTHQNFYSTNDLFMNSQGLSSNISAGTLQHASPKFSFPQQQRFQSQAIIGTPSILELPSQLGSRTTTQGFGNKIVFQWKFQETKAKTLPAPDRYKVQIDIGKDAVKKSFGLSYDAYQKTYLPYNTDLPLDVAKLLPGPGGYNVRQDMGQHRYQFALKGKGRMVNDIKDTGVPGPDKYSPTFRVTHQSRFQKICLGVGERKNPFKSTSFTPGPGRYSLPSPFDKFDISKRNRKVAAPQNNDSEL